MSFVIKSNLAMSMVFIIGLSIVAYIANIILQAGLMTEGAFAIRSYTITKIRPLLKEQSQHTFLPQTVPSYAARQKRMTPTGPSLYLARPIQY